jgi:hypothetical protein
VDSTYKGHRGTDHQPGTQCIEMTDDESYMVYTIPLRLCDALMAFPILLPNEDDLANLPIVDITPDGVWCPSDFNETDQGLSFCDSFFDPPCFAQMTTTAMADPFCDAILTLLEPMIKLEAEPTMDPTLVLGTPTHPTPIEDDDFHDTQTDLLPDDGYFFDPSDGTMDLGFVGRAFHLSLDPTVAIDLTDVDHFLMTIDHAKLRGDNEDFDSFACVSHTASMELNTYTNTNTQLNAFNLFAFASKTAIQDHAHQYIKYLGYQPVDIVWKTHEKQKSIGHDDLTVSDAASHEGPIPMVELQLIMQNSGNGHILCKCTHNWGRNMCSSLLWCVQSHMINVYGMKSESEMPETYNDFIQEEGVPNILGGDNSQIQSGKRMTRFNQEYFIKDEFIEPGHPQQNPAELCAVKFIKNHWQVLLDWTGAPENCWLLACE